MRRPLALVAIAAFLIGTVAPGCDAHTCQPNPIPIFSGGELTSSDAWQSGPLESDWLELMPRGGLNIYLERWDKETRPVVEMHAYISESPHPATSGNFTEGTGNVAEFSHATPGHVWLFNDTCAHFYVRVVLRGGRPLSDGGPLDAASD